MNHKINRGTPDFPDKYDRYVTYKIYTFECLYLHVHTLTFCVHTGWDTHLSYRYT